MHPETDSNLFSGSKFFIYTHNFLLCFQFTLGYEANDEANGEENEEVEQDDVACTSLV